MLSCRLQPSDSGRGLGQNDRGVENATVKEDRILKSEFDPEFVIIIELYFDDQRLNDNLFRYRIKLLDHRENVGIIPRCRTDQEAVRNRIGNDDHFAFKLFDVARKVWIELSQVTLLLKECRYRLSDLCRWSVIQTDHHIFPRT